MKIALSALAIGIVALAASASAVNAQDAHKIVSAQDIKWGAGPNSLPSGAQATVLYGDPSKDGMFALRLKLPKGYHIPPHTHPKPEVVTVLSGTFRLGTGKTADQGQTKALPAGSFFAMSPGMEHYAYTDEETVVQINSSGPWGVTYVNPKDDPRQKTQ
jgi:quercetin dioxygenase-like cupin family protein